MEAALESKKVTARDIYRAVGALREARTMVPPIEGMSESGERRHETRAARENPLEALQRSERVTHLASHDDLPGGGERGSGWRTLIGVALVVLLGFVVLGVLGSLVLGTVMAGILSAFESWVGAAVATTIGKGLLVFFTVLMSLLTFIILRAMSGDEH